MRRVPQEAKKNRATSSFMIVNGNATAVRPTNTPRVARRGTMFEGLRKPMDLMVIVVTLLTYGCPVQAIVHAFDLDERTVASWRDRAGAHCEQVHQALVESGKLDLVHVQADEIRVKGRKMVAWMGLAMMVPTRLWLAGSVSMTRDKGLADALMQQVRRAAQALRPLLVVTDGWAAYPGSIRRAFRQTRQKDGRSRSSLLRGLAAPAHWNGHQANGEKASRGDYPPDGLWSARSGRAVARALRWGERAQYRVYRTLEWNLP